MAFRILSIDGGGLRGVIPLQVLKEIERRTGKPIVESFDLIVGTSTGGIIATAINIPHPQYPTKSLHTLDDIEQLYATHGKDIFPCRNRIGKIYCKARNIFRPNYSHKGLDKILGNYFGNTRLKDLVLPILVTAYDIRLYRPLIFSSRYVNRSSAGYVKGRNIYVKDICRATSAAPVYLPSHSFQFVDDSGQTYYPNCIDGGVFINNPAIAAAVEIIRHNQDPLYNKFTDLSDVYILSLGTGKTDKSIIDKDSKKWGLYKWGLPIIEVMMQANSQAVHHHMEEIFKSNYLRVDIDIEKKFSEMSDSTEETFKYLVAKANKDIVNDPDWLQDIQDFINRASL